MQPIKILSSMATRSLLLDFSSCYERERGQAAKCESVGGLVAAERVRDGEEIDVIVLAAAPMSRLEADGFILSGSRTDLVSSKIAAAVPAGAPAMDISSRDALKAALAAAARVSFSTGPSGDHLQSLWRSLGLHETMVAKATQTPPGVSVASVIAGGEADLGFQQLSELMGTPGVQIVGTLPPEAQLETVFCGGVARTSRQPQAARELLAFLNLEAMDETKRRHGMEPCGRAHASP